MVSHQFERPHQRRMVQVVHAVTGGENIRSTLEDERLKVGRGNWNQVRNTLRTQALTWKLKPQMP